MQMTGGKHLDLPTTKISRKHGRSSGRGREEKAGPSAATSAKGRFNFSVFISFRGEDTRNGFTSHLHKEFESRGIKTFIDSEDLEKGTRIDYLFNCIEESKIFVPVFSKAYADSKWCLKEITKMVEINKREREKRPIVPVFYHVNPSDVKHCQASFEKAFEKHKELGEEQINGWKAALTEVGSISGYCLSQTVGNEAKLITLIAAQISKILSKVPFDIQPIGINSHIKTLKRMLGRENDGNRMIGICGLGGIGKTTIAMALYNELSPTFEVCCFLHNIRENESREGLPLLQAKLMEEVLRDKIDIRNVREGVSLMKQRLGMKKVLLILDDVDHTRQLEAFTANRRRNEAWFGAGSKIIVTTRNKEVLLRHGLKEDEIQCPQVLDQDQSLQLFFHHAFVSHRLLGQLGNLPQEIVKVAAGLPLVLVVFGSHFSLLREKNEWENDLERLKAVQDEEVYKRLRISYESLNHRGKLVFLDIACLFIGQTKEYPICMWEACGCFPESTLKVLQHKSIVKINKDDEFEMHDQIRDMGRMVVAEEGNFDPLKYSRPQSNDQAWQVFENSEVSQGNPHLQCLIWLYIHFPKFSWEAVTAMPELRVMTCYGGDPTAGNKKGIHLPKKLKWFSWRRCPHPTLTFHNNRHEQLRILDLHWGIFRDLGTHSMVSESTCSDTFILGIITYIPLTSAVFYPIPLKSR